MARLSALVFEGFCGQLIQEMGRFEELSLFSEYFEYSSFISVLSLLDFKNFEIQHF